MQALLRPNKCAIIFRMTKQPVRQSLLCALQRGFTGPSSEVGAPFVKDELTELGVISIVSYGSYAVINTAAYLAEVGE